jgi:hypothetical protein
MQLNSSFPSLTDRPLKAPAALASVNLRLFPHPMQFADKFPFNTKQVLCSVLVQSFLNDDPIFKGYSFDSNPSRVCWLVLMSTAAPFKNFEFARQVQDALELSDSNSNSEFSYEQIASFFPTSILFQIHRVKQLLFEFNFTLQPADGGRSVPSVVPSSQQYFASLSTKLEEQSLPFDSIVSDFSLPSNMTQYTDQIRRICQVDLDAIGMCIHLDNSSESPFTNPNFVAENSAAFFGSTAAKLTQIEISVRHVSKIPTCLDSMIPRDDRPSTLLVDSLE